MSEIQYLTHIRAFFSLTYGSMPAENKYPTAHNLLHFRCEAVLREKIFVPSRRKSAVILYVFQRFLTQTGRKDPLKTIFIAAKKTIHHKNTL